MICPMLVITATHKLEPGEDWANCLGPECAWWCSITESCSIPQIAYGLQRISQVLGACRIQGKG
jgi:hypothetical protein